MRSQSINLYFDEAAPGYDRRCARGIWASVRRKEARAVHRLLGPLVGLDALDLGCGTGHYAEQLRARGARVFGVDASAAMVAELKRKGFEGRCAEVASLRLGRKFHVVLAAGLVEFLEREQSLFAAAKEHVLPGGRLVLLAPRAGLAGAAYRLGHEWMGCPVRVRSVQRLEEAAAGEGWQLDRVRGAGPLAVALRFREVSRG